MKSPYDGASRAPIRLVIAAVLAVDIVALSIALAGTKTSELSHPSAPGFLLALGGRPLFIAPIAAAGLAAIGIFARRPARLGAGLAALAALAVLCESHAAILVGPMRVFFSGGTALLGWIAGAAIALQMKKAAGEPRDEARAEALAEVGAAAALAATYVGAATSKLLASGLSWTDANNLRSIVLSQRGLSGRSPLDFYADALITSPGLAWALSALTLCIQIGAVFYPWSPRLRAVCGTLLLAFHLNVWLLTPIFFPQAMALLVVLSYPWPRLYRWARARVAGGARADEEAEVSSMSLRSIAEDTSPSAFRSGVIRAGAVVFMLLAVAATPPIRAYTHLHHRREPAGKPPAEKPAGADVYALLAGISEGGDLAGFHVDAIRGPKGGAVEVLVSRGPVSVALAITKRGARGVPPPKSSARYDIFYDRVRPDASAFTEVDRERLLSALAAALTTTEEKTAPPAGL